MNDEWVVGNIVKNTYDRDGVIGVIIETADGWCQMLYLNQHAHKMDLYFSTLLPRPQSSWTVIIE